MFQLKKIIFFCIIFLSSLSIRAQDGVDYLLHSKYWRYKDRFYKNFIRIDWGGDGIGVFEQYRNQNLGWSGVYTKAGFSIPAASHHPENKFACIFATNGCGNKIKCNEDRSKCHFIDEEGKDFLPECLYTPYNNIGWNIIQQNNDLIYVDPLSPAVNQGIRASQFGHLSWGDDAGLNIGLYLGVLATEYALLMQSEQFDRAKQTLEEVYLCLQALKRLDMTANQWIQRYIEVTSEMPSSDFECKTPFTMDLSGFSGVKLRNDVPFDFWKEFHFDHSTKTTHGHPLYGNTNPEATDEWGTANNAGINNCPEQPDGIPDVHIISAGLASCGASQVQCGWSEETANFLYIQPDDKNYLAHEIQRKIFMSHDQIIALLRGMKLIDVFIPLGTVFNSPNGAVDINKLNADIVGTFLKYTGGTRGNWLVYPCVGFPRGHYAASNQCGYDMNATKWAICKSIESITDVSGGCSARNYGGFYLMAATFSNSTPISYSAQNKRMNYTFFNTLCAIIDHNSQPVYDWSSLKRQISYGRLNAPWIEPFYPLLRKVMNGITDQDFISAGQNAWQVNSSNILVEYKQIMREILNSYGCQANCIAAKLGKDCTAQYPSPDIRCNSRYHYRSQEITENRIDQWDGNNFANEYGNGLDYMLMYNLYHLVFMDNQMKYYDIYHHNGVLGTTTLEEKSTVRYPVINSNYIPRILEPPVFFDENFPRRAFADSIESRATLYANIDGVSNASVIYKASRAIELKPGFKVQLGARFEAKLGELPQCDADQNTYRTVEKVINPNIDSPISKHNIEKSFYDVDIFPNPTSSRAFNIRVNNSFHFENTNIQIFNLMGQEIISNKQLDEGHVYRIALPSNLASGVYYVSISINSNRITKKIILTD